MGRITDTVKTILIINIIFFIGSLTLGDAAYNLFALWFPKNSSFQIWQLLTHMFMHGSAGHIFFNMFALYMFGSHLEHTIGQNKFLFIYFSAGLGAVAFQILFTYFQFMPGYQAYMDAGLSDAEVIKFIEDALAKGRFSVYPQIPQEVTNTMITSYQTPMVGASGAIFGVLAAFAVLYPNLPLYIMFIPIPIKAKYLIGGYFLLDLYAGITGQAILGPSNVAHWAHIGGAVLGFIIMWYWKKNSFNQNRWN
ncbi:rhomboid family intramembrane serine protease [Aquimarina hainanensis]|uniref:Rhomboid family intramembrane serine protease n=1 Tax=Aquimarina hainanensis TaxID=1578017 RepID=A0ABW5N469_9FLAO|nr:rhomboid family intramembrane serine protease [Aquimarina sp. TRL1]QKX05986.1 rhomboid family intramembrane serine protease [Aquimarina sp. TRL1]